MATRITMRARDVGVDHLAQIIPGIACQRFGKPFGGGFCYERLLRDEVVVKSTMGQARTLHQVSHANAIEPSFAKHPGCNRNNPVMIFLLLFLGDPHVRTLSTAPSP
ncbi:hypothetical protein AGR1C_Lc70013 [Agrobacterium fabacearum TT111]|nr:hypothetical protein AGR1C_Lc70013 [Agrobacterium fabacearum TT111]